MAQRTINGRQVEEVVFPLGYEPPAPAGGLTNAELRAAPVSSVTGLEIPKHDHIGLSYTQGNLTGVVYKLGGANGATVATLTLNYDGSSNLVSVSKS